MTEKPDWAFELAVSLTPADEKVPNTPETLFMFRQTLAAELRAAKSNHLSRVLAFLEKAAKGQVNRIHGPATIDWVLGYQACAKAILQDIDNARKGKAQ